jgi:hypothetical protein
MKNIHVTFCFLLVSLFSIASVHAHDPSEHKTKREKPKCEAVKNMDHLKMDANDPIMMAMMKKCMSEESAENHHAGDTEKNTTDDSDANKVDQHNDGHNH